MKQLLLTLLVCLPVFIVAQATFPTDYLGKWGGELEIYSAEGLKQQVPMQLHILPVNDTTFTYTIIYGEDLEAGKRDYLLRPGKQGAHHWVIDEQDGILLDNFYLGGKLHGPFSVMGSMLYSTLELRGEELFYTIASGPAEVFRTSGTTTAESDSDEPEKITVESYAIKGYQKSLLQKLE